MATALHIIFSDVKHELALFSKATAVQSAAVVERVKREERTVEIIHLVLCRLHKAAAGSLSLLHLGVLMSVITVYTAGITGGSSFTVEAADFTGVFQL